MRDSLGGAVVIVIIVVFIVLVSAYMAFNVNYTKAFRMKNKIIDLYEKYNGVCNGDCDNEIRSYAKEIGYDPGSLNCPGDYTRKSNYYCVKKVSSSKSGESTAVGDINNSYYYKIITKINISIPIVDNLLGVRVFSVTGDTELIGG